jgi:hypothetical protein
MSHAYRFTGRSFVGTDSHCEECGGTISEHDSIIFTHSFTEEELQNPENPYHAQYLKLINNGLEND